MSALVLNGTTASSSNSGDVRARIRAPPAQEHRRRFIYTKIWHDNKLIIRLVVIFEAGAGGTCSISTISRSPFKPFSPTGRNKMHWSLGVHFLMLHKSFIIQFTMYPLA